MMTALDLTGGQGFLQRHKGLLALVLLNLLLKGFLLSMTEVVSNDGPVYLNLSKRFLDGELAYSETLRGGYYFYAALVAFFSNLVPGNAVFSLINAGQILSAIFSVLAVVPFYLLMVKVWSQRAAFWGGLLFCVAPGINKYAVDVMRDPGYLLCFLVALYCGWLFMEKPRMVPLLGALIASWLAYLFRVEGFLLLPLLLFWIAIAFFRQGHDGKWLVRSLLLTLTVCAVGGALVWYLRSDFGALSRYAEIAEGAGNLARGKFLGYSSELKTILDESGRQLPGAAHDNDFFTIAKNHIRTIYFIGLIFLVAEVTWPPFFLLAVSGVFLTLRRGCRSWYVSSFLVTYLLLGFFYNMQRNYLEERYVYSVVVLLLAYAGCGVAMLLEGVSKHRFGGAIFALVLLLVTVPATAENIKYRRKWQSHPFKEAGLWLAAQSDIKEARLLANERKIPFYAGRYGSYSPVSFDIRQMSGLGPDLVAYDYIAIEGGEDYRNKIVELENFKIVKQIESDRYVAVIYKKNAY